MAICDRWLVVTQVGGNNSKNHLTRVEILDTSLENGTPLCHYLIHVVMQYQLQLVTHAIS